MLNVTDKASEELKKFFITEQNKNNHLIVYFQGVG
jgi:hypothetical protein